METAGLGDDAGSGDVGVAAVPASERSGCLVGRCGGRCGGLGGAADGPRVGVLVGEVQQQQVDVVVSPVTGGLVRTDGVSGSLLAAGGDGLVTS